MTGNPNPPVINPLHPRYTMANNTLDKATDFVFLLLARQSSNELDFALASFVGCRPYPNSVTAFRFSLKSFVWHSMQTTVFMTIA